MADMTIFELDPPTLELLTLSQGQTFSLFELGVADVVEPPAAPIVTPVLAEGSPFSSGTAWQALITGVGVVEILVWVAYADLNVVEVAYNGSTFTPDYKAQSSLTDVGGNTQRVTVKRGNGWPASPRFFIRARNAAGGVNS